MKKFLLTLLAVIFAVCLAGAVACSGNGSGVYHVLVFTHADGVEYVFDTDIQSGMEVKDGVTVNFSLKIDEEATGDPAVYANEEKLTPDGNGVYSVKVVADTYVKVVGVSSQGEYSQLIFDNVLGVSFVPTNENLKNGMYVRRGSRVEFRVMIAPGYEGVPAVYANGMLLQPDENGNYSFILEKETHITCENITKNVSLVFSSGEATQDNGIMSNIVRYLKEDGTYYTTDKELPQRAGDVIKFKPKVSVYMKQEPYNEETERGYRVTVNNNFLTPDENGYYSVTLQNEVTTIALTGLEQDEPYSSREDGGDGTALNPYKISKPIDLYQMSALINSAWFTELIYRTGYYELTQDIDLEGEQLYIIGNMLSSNAFFGGNFNGNGHTISNFFITDTVLDQSSTFDSPIYLRVSNVGLFGYVTAAANTTPSIYNLNLDNYRISANCSQDANELYLGSFAGVGFGINLTGCSATNGQIEVVGSYINPTKGLAPAYVGGLVGGQSSAASVDGSIRVYSGITSCHSDVQLNIAAGYVYSMGGITGLLTASTESLAAYILNSYSTSSVVGGIRAGGVVGYAAPGTSVINCYSAGQVRSSNPISDTQYGEYCNSYAGGVVGHAGFNTVISNSFSKGVVVGNASANNGNPNNGYAKSGPVVGYCDNEDDLEDASSCEPVILNSYGGTDLTVDENFIRNTLKWHEADWLINNGMPVINLGESSKTFTVSFSVSNDFSSNPGSLEIKNTYKPMSSWYDDYAMGYSNNSIPEYKNGNGNLRSYGYFFDEKLENRVPYCFIPTDNITLYIGYADYTPVLGTYYIDEEYSDSATIEFDLDGNAVFRDGALNHHAVYNWNGTKLVLKYSPIGMMSKDAHLTEVAEGIRDYYLSSYYNFGATVKDGKIVITGGHVYEVEYESGDNGEPLRDESGNPILVNTGETFELFTDASPLSGYKGSEDFNYGKYYVTGGSSVDTYYIFKVNFTGERVTGDTHTPFTYKIGSGNVEISIGGQSVTATLSDGYINKIDNDNVKPYDGFAGTWETEYNFYKNITFDGFAFNGSEGHWERNDLESSSEGTYTVEDGVLKDKSNAFTAHIDEETGLLILTVGENETSYYKEGSFTGEWYFAHRSSSLSIKFGGIGKSGYGSAMVETITGVEAEMTYVVDVEKDNKTVTIYNNDQFFARLTYNEKEQFLEGEIDGLEARLTAYDNLRGVWVSNNQDIYTIQFSGNGYYDLAGSRTGLLEVRPKVWITSLTEEGTSKRTTASYKFDRKTSKGTFNFNGKEYSIEYLESTKGIKVTQAGTELVLGALDKWYNVELKDNSGYIYTFDGRGDLEGGGTLTAVNRSESGYRAYTYVNNPDGSITLTGKDIYSDNGTIKVENDASLEHNVWMLTSEDGEKTSLTLNTAFTGSWIIGGEPGTITIGDIYADYTASGTVQFYGQDSKSVTFNYQQDLGCLTFTLKDDDADADDKGYTYYVNALSSDSANELSIGPDNSITSSRNSICILSENADEWHNKVLNVRDKETGEDTGEKFVFDGLSNSTFSNGRTVMYNKDGNIINAFVYGVNKYKYAQIIMYGNSYVLVECQKDDKLGSNVLYSLHDEDEQYYKLVRPDALMDHTIRDRFSPNVGYEFDGVESVYVNGVKRYTYELTEDNAETHIYTVTFTEVASSGTDKKEYQVYLNYSADYMEDWTIFIPGQYNLSDDKLQGVTYRFKDNFNIILNNSDGTSAEYAFSVDEYDYEEYVHILTLSREVGEGDEKYTETFKIALDMSGSSASDWHVHRFDEMYGITISDKLAKNVVYKFDGDGNVEREYPNGDTTEFKYTIEVSEDEKTKTFKFESNGKIYNAEVDMSSKNSAEWTVFVYDLTVSDKLEKGAAYEFKNEKTLIIHKGEDATEYSYELDINNRTYIHTLKLTGEDEETITLALNMSLRDMHEWYALVYGTEIKDGKNGSVTYVIKDSDTITSGEGESEISYRYTFVSSENYIHTLNVRDSKNFNHTAILDTSDANSANWTLTMYDVLYNLTIADRLESGTTYKFDGDGKVTVNKTDAEAKEYSYTLSDDSTSITLTADGEKITLALNISAKNTSDWYVFVCGTTVKDGKQPNKTYTLQDGSTIISGDTKYTFVFVSTNRMTYTHTLTITDSDDKTYTVILKTSGDTSEWTLTFCDDLYNVKASGDERGVTYTFDGLGGVVRRNSDRTTVEYTYTIESAEGGVYKLKLTDNSQTEISAELTLKDGAWTLTITPVNGETD